MISKTPVTGDGAPARGTPGPAAVAPGRPGISAARLATVVIVVGVLITSAVAWAAWALNRRNEQSLVQVQTRQAAEVIRSSILSISAPLSSTLRTEEATDGDVEQFRRAMGPVTGPGRIFVGAALYEPAPDGMRLLASVGEDPEVGPDTEEGLAFLRRSLTSPTFVVTSPGVGRVDRVAYALSDAADPRYVVYAERAIPANRLVPVESNPAFADLDFATYLGPEISTASLATTNLPLDRLPLTHEPASVVIPFGDTTVTLVAEAHTQLGGSLGQQLPWILLVAGLVLTAVTAATAVQLVRARRRAEADGATISALYESVDRLYGEQRTIAETLQRALLPRSNPVIPGVAVASRYVAGAKGVDIGGDWYSVVRLDDSRFGFVVGDVSGRGVSAAAVMARMRFTIRAYLLEGHPPDVVLEKSSTQIDVEEDDHFVTVLVGVSDARSREVVLASAGHLDPLVVDGGSTYFVDVSSGPPLGIGATRYDATTVTLPPGAVLVGFTDGLVERRGEVIDTGFARLAEAARAAATSGLELEQFVTTVVGSLTDDGSEDDVAVLALGWHDPDVEVTRAVDV